MNQAQILLNARASLFREVRDYFTQTGALEVDVPVLGRYAVTDPQLDSMLVETLLGRRYLQTSPEYFMKRLLCQVPQDMFALTKAFRDESCGRRHNPEFAILEWYRVGMDDRQLMQDVERLLKTLFPELTTQIFSYAQVFKKTLGINPHTAEESTLQRLVRTHTSFVGELDRDGLLDLLMAEVVEPALPEGLVFITDYPATMASLARMTLDSEGNPVGRRFEAYLNRIEIANGYWELGDYDQQRTRFEEDNRVRAMKGLSEIAIDSDFLRALQSGLPDCAGVALGLDRLLMYRLGAHSLDEVMFFRL